MNHNQDTLRSFINAAGKLVLCNEPFFTHFGHCTQHLIGKSVTDVFSSFDCRKILHAMEYCQSHPGQCCTVETQKGSSEGCDCFRWEMYAEQASDRMTGIHLVGQSVKKEEIA
jgi:hypothetical protein